MLPELLAFVQGHGGGGLPWREWPGWHRSPNELQVRAVEVGARTLVIGLFSSGTLWVFARLYAPGEVGLTYCQGEWALLAGETNPYLAKLMASIQRDLIPDPRLSELSAELRARATEFLDLHDAWETNFAASGTSTVYLDWPSEDAEVSANYSQNGGWLIRYAVPGTGTYFTLQSRSLTRSADFADFIQQFHLKGEALGAIGG